MLSFDDFMTMKLGHCGNPGGWTAVVNQMDVSKLYWECQYSAFKSAWKSTTPKPNQIQKPPFRIINKK